MRCDHLHLTLVFLGNVAREKIPQLTAVAEQRQSAAFNLEFGTIDYWRHNHIVWAAPHVVPPPLHELVAALDSALSDAGFAFDRRPYVPHVTLLRDARPPAVAPTLTFDWPVRDFALVETARNERGVAYDVLGRWPLG